MMDQLKGAGNAAARATVGFANLMVSIGDIDGTAQPFSQWQPFTPKSNYFGAQGGAIFDGLTVFAGGRSFGGGLAGDVDVGGATLADRAAAVHGALDPIAAGRRTTAAMDTAEGTRVIASGGRDLTPAQRALLSDGEAGAKMPGAHAEITLLNHAAQNGLSPLEISVTRTICPSCARAIEQAGGQLITPTSAVWPR